ncbi:MAG TPA: DUF2723 domain-containing protein [Anaerolineae bacterium]|nr:DUF2723 domain-containing protein [Anaerolineae bacterium]
MNFLHRLNAFTHKHLTALLGLFIFIAAFGSYVATLAPAQVPGDPSEYTFIPWILGIAHPPGYGFYTLLASVWQHIIPIGSVAYRSNLLAACAGASSATLVYLIVQRLTMGRSIGSPISKTEAHLPAVFAGLSFAAAIDVWQHSLHANAHIITLLLATLSVFLLIEWWSTDRDRWLYLFALIVGFSPAQHPLLIFGFPAYLIFIVLVKPRLFLRPNKILALSSCVLIGLSIFLYYPLRSPTTPFGVSDIHSWDTFLHFVSAEGLRVNLFHFGLADQLTRFSVFINLLQLQFSSISILFAIPGIIWLARRSIKPFVLCFTFLVITYAFIINTVQDVMAYLLLPFMMLAVFIGIGVWVVALAFVRSATLRRLMPIPIAFALLLIPINTFATNSPRVSLKNYTVGSEWVNAVFDRFAGKGEYSILLAPWEAMTPLWVAQYVESRTLDPKDVTPVYVTTATANPWLDSVFANFDKGPVYLADYRRPVVEGKLFRLRPEGTWPLWRVVAPGDTSVPHMDHPLNISAGGIELLGYSIDRTTLEAGQTAHLTLAMRSSITPPHIMMPYALVSDKRHAWTTDSRLLTPDWLPNEVIVDRYDITLPFNTPAAEVSLKLGIADLAAGHDLSFVDGSSAIDLGSLQVITPIVPHIESAEDALADFNAQIALIDASAIGNGRSIGIKDKTELTIQPGGSIQVWLRWIAEQQIDESYTVFVHLINDANQLFAQQDYTPMGGAFPTQLWIPRWIEGQMINDPYTIDLPSDLPPGEYSIEAGMYGMTSGQRVTIIGHDGSLAGDRVILFKVKVAPP